MGEVSAKTVSPAIENEKKIVSKKRKNFLIRL